MDWWTYHYDNVMLARDFIGLDANSKEITKEEFLKNISRWSFYPDSACIDRQKYLLLQTF
ncbi:hypothetical protein [Flavobacterium sp. GNP001]